MLERIRKNLWLLPLLFAALLGVFAWTTLRSLEETMRAQVRSSLETTRESAIAAIDIWQRDVKAAAAVPARDPRVVAGVEALVEHARRAGETREAAVKASALAGLRTVLDGYVAANGWVRFGVTSASGFMLANTAADSIGRRPPGSLALSAPIFAGDTVLTPPTLWDTHGDGVHVYTTMVVATPIRNAAGDVIAGLGFSIDPEAEFSRILNVARPGESGETYAFDADGMLLSRSRFEDQLREIGLLPDDPEVDSALRIHIRNPGGNMVQGFQPDLAPRARPLTKMAASAVSGETSSDVQGYEDYRGVPVVGAWTWLPDLQMGITSEMDVAEAFSGLFAVRTRLFWLIGLLAVAGIGMFAYSFLVLRLQSAVAEARELGRYKIERKIGKGGMGTVYLARHSLLRRPTAIKVLDGARADDEGVARFEREVQVSCALTHPNTIEIYDYGYTPQGVFYYAMELLRGITVDTCVGTDGPQPDARVVHVMKQVCASIAEAHGAGLIHRDLKPSNVMLCDRGGMLDFVKVLDFGLVRQQQQSEDVALTAVNALTGTPLYMSPESVESPDTMDARSDVYQLGAILYFMLTGSHVFQGETPVEVLAQHLNKAPEPPSERLGRPVLPELEAVIMKALAKSADDRHADAGALLGALEACPLERSWTQADARAWWSTWTEAHGDEVSGDGATTGSIPSGWEIDFERRDAPS